MTDIKSGRIYIYADRQSAYDVLKEKSGQGYEPLIFSRTHPSQLKADFTLQNIADERINWITSSKSSDPKEIAATSLEHIFSPIRDFTGEKGQIMIDGIDYLIQQYSFENVYKLVNKIYDLIATKDCFLLMPVELKTLEPKEYALFCSRNIVRVKKILKVKK